MFYALLVALVMAIGVPYLPMGEAYKKERSAMIKIAFARFVLGLVIGGFVSYVTHPNWMTGYGWMWFTPYFLLAALIQAFERFFLFEDKKSKVGFKATIVGLSVVLLAMLYVGGLQYRINRADTYKMFSVQEMKSGENVPPFNGKEFPIVPQQTALKLARNALSSYGQSYQVDKMSIERLSIKGHEGELWYVGAIDFQDSLTTWWSVRHNTPGYILVSATDRDAQPIPVTDHTLHYTLNGMFGDSVERLVDQQFPDYYFGDIDLEIDQDGKPYWVASAYTPTTGIYFSNSKAVGSVLVDAETGSMQFFPIGKQPKWVSQVIGSDYVSAMATEWGLDKRGFMAFGNTGKIQPVDTPIGVVDSKNNLLWYTGLTSLNENDKSLVGYMLTNAQTGASTFYPAKGLQNGDAALERVQGAVTNTKLHATEPVFYNLFGHPAFIAPIVNDSNNLVQYAVIDPTNSETPVIGNSLDEALSKWQDYLASGVSANNVTDQSQKKTVSGKVKHLTAPVRGGNTVWFFEIGDQKFMVPTDVGFSTMPFVSEGDYVNVDYVHIPGQIDTVSKISVGK